MSSVRVHYDHHLARVYSWMAGGIDAAVGRGEAALEALDAVPRDSGIAVDLGAGFGMHAIPLARRGFRVIAIDSCAELLAEMGRAEPTLPIDRIEADLCAFRQVVTASPELILCMGDTLTHLPDRASVTDLIGNVAAILPVGGRFVLSFRDYSVALTGTQRFVSVRSDARRMLTCFLEYSADAVTVHDLIHERGPDGWQLSVSAYDKQRLTTQWVVETLEANGLAVERRADRAGMVLLLATHG